MDRIRIDKWLWFARFFKSRSLAQAVIGEGRVELNGQPVAKSSLEIRPGDVLAIAVGPTGRPGPFRPGRPRPRLRHVRVLAVGERRGPAPEARTLYIDLPSPPDAAGDDTAGDGTTGDQ
jgi:ribosome-associated heat shock protein Hsp15